MLCVKCPYAKGIPILHKGSRVDHRQLALVSIFKDEEYLMKEWIDFHIKAGIEHFYLYNDESIDSSVEILQPYIKEGLVTLIPWSNFIGVEAPGSPRQLMYAYAHAVRTFGRYWRWMAFVDLDEFLFSKKGSLVDSLAEYSDLPAIVVPWFMYGTCNHEKRPEGTVVENFTQRMQVPPPEHTHRKLYNWKLIVDPMRVEYMPSPHCFAIKNLNGIGYTDTKKLIDKLDRSIWENEPEVFQMNHYFTLSKEDFFFRRGRFNFAASSFYAKDEKARDDRLKMMEDIDANSPIFDDSALDVIGR